MTDKELAEIEGELEAAPVHGYWHDSATLLIAEVRRLRELESYSRVSNEELRRRAGILTPVPECGGVYCKYIYSSEGIEHGYKCSPKSGPTCANFKGTRWKGKP